MGETAEGEARGGGQPRRVVSINLCTDQLAMTLAAPGQLLGVSYLAADPRQSVQAGEAGKLALNHGQAEEVYLLKPDLVLAGTYSSRRTVGLLRRMGFRVEEFAPAASFADIESQIIRMGALLHQEARAARLVADMHRQLARLPRPDKRETAIFYFRGGTLAGADTLAGHMLEQAGFENLAKRLQLRGAMQDALENLLLHQPDYSVRSRSRYATGLQDLREASHPALRRVLERSKQIVIADPLSCGGPFSVDVVRMLVEARHD